MNCDIAEKDPVQSSQKYPLKICDAKYWADSSCIHSICFQFGRCLVVLGHVRFGRVVELGQTTVDTSLLFNSSVGGAATASSGGTKSGMCVWRQPTFDDFWHIMVV